MTRRNLAALAAWARRTAGPLSVAAAVILLPGGAGAQEAPAPAGVPSPPELPRQDFPEAVLGSLRAALGAYEEVRAALAADRLEEVPAGASRLAGALRQALEAAAGLADPTPAVLQEAAAVAESMAPADDLWAAREAFGEVSRQVLLLAGSDPRLAEGLHVFHCPMAAPFGKWVQPAETLENPYMGQAMLACGTPADWSVPAPLPAVEAPTVEARSSTEAAGPEPEFAPGIAGLEMEDVRDQRFLWREIEELQGWERSDRITVAEYRGKVIEKTVQFLQLERAAADEFTAAAAATVAGLRESFRRRGRDGTEPGEMEARFSSDLQSAVNGLTALLGDKPRHRLFEPDCKKWLLKLAFGPREAKEAREAQDGNFPGRLRLPGNPP